MIEGPVEIMRVSPSVAEQQPEAIVHAVQPRTDRKREQTQGPGPMPVQRARSRIAEGLNRRQHHQWTIESETNIQALSADRADGQNENQSAKTRQQRCAHIDSPYPSMQCRPARTNLADQLDATQNQNHAAGKEMQPEPGS